MKASKFVFLVLLFAANAAFAQSIDKKYFANTEIQRLSPEAFALQPESRQFLEDGRQTAALEIKVFLDLIQSNSALIKDIKNFAGLRWDKKEEVLREVFALEVQALGIKAPELIIDADTIKGEAFFDFDLKNPGPGKVILNPKAIQLDSNPYAALMLLIHETRHSGQLQRAFTNNDPLSHGFFAAFYAQKELAADITSFSDFLTLNNEYEAFSFGNYIVGSLTDWKADTLGMGTFASQYNADRTLKIDLQKLFLKFDNGEIKDSVLEEFNRMEKVQYELLKAQ